MSPSDAKLSRREREIMDLIYLLGEATATEIQKRMDDAPSNTSVRTLLKILEEKGHLTHRVDGKRYVYKARQSKLRSGRSALDRVLRVYFGASLEKAVSAHLADPKADITDDELNALDDLIQKAREEKRSP